MIVLPAHKTGSHKSYNDTLAKSRQIAYTYKAGYLIRRILDSCVYCKIIQLIPGNDSIVRRVLIEYFIQSTKQMCVNIRRLDVLPKLDNN